MKLQIKLALYNALTKLAIILFTGGLMLISLEQLTYHHIATRLTEKKHELIKHLSQKEIAAILNQQQSFIDYNILKEEYIVIKPIRYQPSLADHATFATEARTIEHETETYRILKSAFNFQGHSYYLEIGETMYTVEELKSTIKGFALLMLFIALTLTMLIDLTFTRFLLKPFYQIIDRKLIKVNDPLNFDYEKVKTSTQDFELLDNSISSLMTKISNLFMLEKQFIANVSHELLTPISIISSRLENILQQEGLTVESENKIFASLKTLNRMKSIINSLLLISKIENNQFNKTDQVVISDIIKEVSEELEDRLEDKKIQFNNHTYFAWTMQANRTLMYTLLFNIINNAIKYNKTNGGIFITDKLQDDVYTLEITDTGIGMNDKEIEMAFNRFEKLDTNQQEGYGLGLAIAKSISAFHNIGVQITSAKNAGTTFRLIFSRATKLH
ncbi:MAG: sensor histidine kinase [Mucilaginibacter sp.]